MKFFHLFFPSWSFYSNLGEFPVVEIRTGGSAESLSDWKPLLKALTRHWTQIFYNPQGNLALTVQTQAGKIISGGTDTAQAQQILQNLCGYHVDDSQFFQWRVISLTANSEGHYQEFFTSAITNAGKR